MRNALLRKREFLICLQVDSVSCKQTGATVLLLHQVPGPRSVSFALWWEYLSENTYLTLWSLMAAGKTAFFNLNSSSMGWWIGFEISKLVYCFKVPIHIESKHPICSLCVLCPLYLMQSWLLCSSSAVFQIVLWTFTRAASLCWASAPAARIR